MNQYLARVGRLFNYKHISDLPASTSAAGTSNPRGGGGGRGDGMEG